MQGGGEVLEQPYALDRTFTREVVWCIGATSVLEAQQELKKRGTRKTHCLGLQSFPPFLSCRGTLPIFTEAPVSLWQQGFLAAETPNWSIRLAINEKL